MIEQGFICPTCKSIIGFKDATQMEEFSCGMLGTVYCGKCNTNLQVAKTEIETFPCPVTPDFVVGY